MAYSSVWKIICSVKLWCHKSYKDLFVFKSGVDFYGKIRRFESVCGFHANCTTTREKLLWVLYRLVFVTHFLEQSMKFVQSFLIQDDAQTVLIMQATYFSKISNIIQLIVLRQFYQEIVNIRTFINTHNNRRSIGNPEAFLVRDAVYRKIAKTSIRPLVFNAIIWAIFMLGGLNKLPFVLLELDFTSDLCWLGTTIQFVNDLFYFILLMWFQLSNAIISSLFYGLSAELTIVADSFDNWFKDVLLAVDAHFEDRCIFVTVNYRRYLFWQYCHPKLRDRAKELCEILENITLLKQIMKPYLFVQYYSLLVINIGLCCITLFGYIPTVPALPIVFVVYMNAEFCKLCMLERELNDALITIGDRIYNLPWMYELRFNRRLFRKQYQQVKTSILLLLTFTQQGVTFSCGGFFDMNMEMITKLLNSSYSMIMFAQTMHYKANKVVIQQRMKVLRLK